MAGEKVKSVAVENGSADSSKKVKGAAAPVVSEVMTFGSHGPEEAVDGSADFFPKNVKDDWDDVPTKHSKDVVNDRSASHQVQQLHSFWFVKSRIYVDPKTEPKLDVAKKEVKNKTEARKLIIEKLKGIRSQRHQISAKITPLSEENNKFKSILDDKKEKLEPMNQVMRPNNGGSNRDRGENICSSLDELNRLIKSLEYRIQHESITLKEEKEIMREIKQLEGTREQVAAKDAHRAKIEESLGGKQAMQEQFNLIGDGVSGMKKERQVIAAKIKKLMDERKEIDKDIEKIEKELDAATEKETKAKEAVWEVYKMSDNANASYHQNKAVLEKARNIANKKDIAAIKEFNKLETEKFMKAWNESKPFRDDYEKRIIPNFDQKGFTKDGRQRNPDEKPIFAPEPSTSSKPEPVVKPKQPKSEPVPAEKEPKSKPAKEVKSKETEPVDVDEKEIVLETEKPKKEEKKVDEAKLKEIRREEEIAKAKQALERKKKLAEKAAAKAAIKAQKEAEKKLKDREKKLKKKNPFSLEAEPEEQPAEEEAEVAEPEKTEEAAEKPVNVAKSKGPKKSAMRNRSRANGPDSISKVILKRKKATNYWVWAAPAAAVSLMAVFAIGYQYFV